MLWFLSGLSAGIGVPFAVQYVKRNQTSLMLTTIMLYERVLAMCKRPKAKSTTIMIGDYTVHAVFEYQFPVNGEVAWKDIRNPHVLPRKNPENRYYALELTTGDRRRSWVQFISGNIETAKDWPFNPKNKHIDREGLSQVTVNCRGASKDMTADFLRLESPEQNFGGATITLMNVFQMSESLKTVSRARAEGLSPEFNFNVKTLDRDIKNIAPATTLHELDMMLSSSTDEGD